MRSTCRLAPVVVAAATLAACGSARHSLGPDPSPGASLAGTTWRLVSVDGQHAVAGVRVTAVFEDERVSGSAGCNGYSGRATVAGGRLEVGPLVSTRMFCSAQGVMTQEQAYLAALEKAKAHEVAGSELRLGPAPGVVTLRFRAE